MVIKNVTWSNSERTSSTTFDESNPNLSTVVSSHWIRATEVKTKGKWYWEVTRVGTGVPMFGIVSATVSTATTLSYTNQLFRLYYTNNGTKYPEASTYGTSVPVGNTVSILMDLDNNTLEFWNNGESQGISHNNLIDLPRPISATFTAGSSTRTSAQANFGESPFIYTPPEGYLPYNISEVEKVVLKDDEGFKIFRKGQFKSENGLIPVLDSERSLTLGNVFTNRGLAYPYRAFDDNPTTIFNGLSQTDIKLTYEFVDSAYIDTVEITPNTTVISSPFDFNIEYSDDGENFTILRSEVSYDWGTLSTVRFDVPLTKVKFIRLNILRNQQTTVNNGIRKFQVYLLNHVVDDEYITIANNDYSDSRNIDSITNVNLKNEYHNKIQMQFDTQDLGYKIFKSTVSKLDYKNITEITCENKY